MSWQPIETAAKNNRGVLGWFHQCKCTFTMVWDSERGWISFGGSGDFHGEQPTHWMPIPDGPDK